jgi:DNA invertase Pin-like site-specific DNA recombinase
MTDTETLAAPAARSEAPVIKSRTFASELASPKIHSYHRDRLAVVYVRQSTPQQVIEHRESTERQYALADRAVALGWPADRVLVIDEDQGQSGRTAEGRSGFQRLLVELNLDHVGLILGLEMSRLARSNKDWHHLLEVCTIFRTLLADSDGIYEPNDPNDRMLLGLKGTISEVELHTLRNRLNQGRWNKARRGRLFTTAPIGYVRLPADELALDPDEQVRAVVRLIFDKFAELRSASAVLKYLARHRIQIGVRRPNGRVAGPVVWHRPGYSTLLGMLHNPTYAGVYTQGRRTSDPRRRRAARRGPVPLSIDEWQVLLPDAVPAYIRWDEFTANQETLKANHAHMSRMGSARNGNSLLSGLLICGHCGSRMVVQYPGRSQMRYYCVRNAIAFADEPCQNLKGGPLDALVAEKVLQVLEPAALELSLCAAADVQRERDRLHQNWQQRVERARYETQRAVRQYDTVEPENRLVARSLEQRWETTLHEQKQIEEEYDRFLREQPQALSAEESERIRSLSAAIPNIWHSTSTAPQDRKLIVRSLIDRVVVKNEGRSEHVDVTIHWAGGYTSAHQITQSIASFERLADFSRLKERIIQLHREGRTYRGITAQLAKEHFHSPYGRDRIRPESLRQFVRRYCVEELGPYRGSFRQYLKANEWLVGDLARELGMPQATIKYWIRRGWIHGRQISGPRGRWVLWVDEEELDRLRRLAAHPRDFTRHDQQYPQALITPKPNPEWQRK